MGGDLMAQQWDVPGYTGVKVLGSGGFGEVVLARHDASGSLVAIKYLRRELLADAEFAALFRAEAAVLASLDDPNVVRLYEYVESPAGAAIVMELVDGVSLRDILVRQGKTTAEAALVVLQGSLLGLAAAHQRGVVHRDYKPENVLIDGDGASKPCPPRCCRTSPRPGRHPARRTRTSPTGRKTRSRTDAARTTSPMPATRLQRCRMTRLRRTRRPSPRCGRQSRTSTACRSISTTRYDGAGDEQAAQQLAM
jgi:serine/threonine protein kinase